MIDSKTTKTFVIDTNVLLHNPNALFAFADNHVVIPMMVLEELDKFKSANNELGSNSREVARALDRLRLKGSLRDGIATPQGGRVQVLIPYDEIAGMLPGVNDNRILGCAQLLKREGKNVFFISKDINARVKADALGIPSEDFENQKINVDELYNGWVRFEREASRIKQLSLLESIAPDDLEPSLSTKLNANQFVLAQEGDDDDLAVLFSYNAMTKKLHRLDGDSPQLFGVGPRSQEQRMAFELLLDDRIKLVTLVGQAGTGKTLLALACGLAKVIHDERYKKLLVSRPIMPLGNDIGYLPGTKDEKLSHWMGPIFDNLHFLLASEERDPDEVIKRLIQEESITMEALTYIRGRSISKQYLIVGAGDTLYALTVAGKKVSE